MSHLKITPGPWSFHRISNPTIRSCTDNGQSWDYADYTIGVGDKMIADVRYGTHTMGYPAVDDEGEFTANARLIAAAPDLYAACLAVADSGMRNAAYDACVAALAKASAA